ncbi:TPA: DUF2304 domain-containing protein, partial [Streptococcus pyogenes]|nr:DUF2304 domain-containing protein [Streptococcus pyogenes]HEP2991724.1 DUF2304 domain-containing protein [Streptococcus pyogenes]HEQ5426986.1 DUF2304 domain-containing protein [Streptococcus pyogenes]HER4001393.1 DUF2304 domain-containing protein [Streptococcus pyogenes]
ISLQNDKVKRLTQEVALMKKEKTND